MLRALAHDGERDRAGAWQRSSARVTSPSRRASPGLPRRGDALTALLGPWPQRRPGRGYLRDLVRGDAGAERRRAAPARTPAAAGRLVDPLSDRELDVLRLLATRPRRPAIARELVVSLNTVRTHTKHIYTKLGVNNRRAAISKAHQLGLLSAAAAAEDHHLAHQMM